MNSFKGYFGISIASSLGHYLFQVIAARILGNGEFSLFSAQWASLNMFMLLGTWGQYWFALQPKNDRLFFNFFKTGYLFSSVGILIFFLTKDFGFLIFSLLMINISHAVLSGKLLSQARFYNLGWINLLPALLKIFLILILPVQLQNSTTVFLIIFISVILTHIIYFFIQIPPEAIIDVPNSSTGFGAAFVLSIATHFFPSGDLLWASWFRDPSVLIMMSPLSLVSRAVFFFQLIISQWWLPRASNIKWIQSPLSIGMISVAVILGSYLSALVLHIILKYALGWTLIPSISLFFLASLNAGFMALHFQSLQLSLLKGSIRKGGGVLCFVIGTWFLLGVSKLQIEAYFAILAGAHAIAFISGIGIKQKGTT